MIQGKVPPYAKPLLALQRSGLRPNNDIYLFTGPHAWRKAAGICSVHPERILVLPAWHDPEEYLWPVKDCGVMIFDTGWALDEYIDDTVGCLFRDGARKVYFIPTNLETLIIFNKEITNVSS
jgi:hypothetical protein